MTIPEITTCKVSRALKTGRTNTCRPSLFLPHLFQPTIGKQQPSLLDPVSESPAQFCECPLSHHIKPESCLLPASFCLPSITLRGEEKAGGVMNMSCASGPRAKFHKNNFCLYGGKSVNYFLKKIEEVFQCKNFLC